MAGKSVLLAGVVATVIPLVAAGILVTHNAEVRVDGASECAERASDSDVEYAGDSDQRCASSSNVEPSAAPAPKQTPAASHSSPAPTSRPAKPSPTSTTQKPSPAPNASPPPRPGAFPVAYFAPYFTGPATRQFSQQFIGQIGNYVEVTYPAGSSSPSSGVPGGAQARLPDAAGPLTDATLTYSVRFPVGFQWVKGGKLPGLCGGACWTGSQNGPGGWTTRFMWRAGGAGEVLLSDATTTGYGSDLGLGKWYFPADGRWHSIGQHVHLNTPGAADGYIDVTFDGVLVAHLTGITFRTSSATEIDSLMFSTFFGGHDSSWASPVTQHIDFANFRLT